MPKMREIRPYPKSMPLRKESELYPKTKGREPQPSLVRGYDERDDDSLVASLEVNNVNHGVVGDVIWVKPKANGHTLKMELDTGSAISIHSPWRRMRKPSQTHLWLTLPLF